MCLLWCGVGCGGGGVTRTRSRLPRRGLACSRAPGIGGLCIRSAEPGNIHQLYCCQWRVSRGYAHSQDYVFRSCPCPWLLVDVFIDVVFYYFIVELVLIQILLSAAVLSTVNSKDNTHYILARPNDMTRVGWATYTGNEYYLYYLFQFQLRLWRFSLNIKYRKLYALSATSW